MVPLVLRQGGLHHPAGPGSRSHADGSGKAGAVVQPENAIGMTVESRKNRLAAAPP